MQRGLSRQQKRFNLNHHEAPLHDRKKGGGHVLLKHVDPTAAYIERRFTKEKHAVVSFFTSKEEAERIIHKVLKDNSNEIDAWLKNALEGDKISLKGYISGKGTVVTERANRQRTAARHIEVVIIKKEHNGMIDYVHTVKLD